MANKTKLLMVEDHKLLRVGLKAIFEESETLDVIGEAEDGKTAVELAKTLKPEVVLMDIGLPVMNGIEATKKIKEANPDIKVIVLTSHSDENEVMSALAAGASAYAMKDIKTEYLLMVIQSVKEGAIWLDPAIAQMVIEKNPSIFKGKIQSRASFKEEHANLTEREYEVLKLVVEGNSNSEIAQILNISEHTAKAHVCNIIQKLVVDDRTQAAVKAIKEGIV
ncbi:MAG: response regulator transcription factor [Candidatus Gastranaerophilales bacterium]|nr:response regulator transcription factor [Candidatus Gastranaerophilales bacterium]